MGVIAPPLRPACYQTTRPRSQGPSQRRTAVISTSSTSTPSTGPHFSPPHTCCQHDRTESSILVFVLPRLDVNLGKKQEKGKMTIPYTPEWKDARRCLRIALWVSRAPPGFPASSAAPPPSKVLPLVICRLELISGIRITDLYRLILLT